MVAVGYLAAARQRWLAVLGIVILILGIFITYSRPTAIVMVLGVVVFFFLRSGKRISITWRAAVGILGLAGLAAAILLIALPRSFVGTVFFRFGMWQQTLAFFQKFPSTLLLGGGFPRILYDPFAVWDTHNMYLFLAVSYGVPGLLVFLAMFGHIIRGGWRVFSSSFQNPMAPHAAAALSALACFLIRGFVESQVNELDLRFAFVFFLVYAAETLREELPRPLPIPMTTPA
jgi:O-antigen ligase